MLSCILHPLTAPSLPSLRNLPISNTSKSLPHSRLLALCGVQSCVVVPFVQQPSSYSSCLGSQPVRTFASSKDAGGIKDPKLRLVPFTVTPEEAVGAYWRHHSSSIWLAKPTPYSRVKEVYLPFWCFDMSVDVQVCSAQVGRSIMVARVNPTNMERETAWETQWTVVQLGWSYAKHCTASSLDMQLYASDKYNAPHAARMRPGQAVHACIIAQPMHMDAFGGGLRRTLPFTLPPDKAQAQILTRIGESERQDVEYALLHQYNADRVRFLDLRVVPRGVAAHPLSVPAYVFATLLRGVKVHTFVSGIAPAAAPKDPQGEHTNARRPSFSLLRSRRNASGVSKTSDTRAEAFDSGDGHARPLGQEMHTWPVTAGVRVYDENKVATAAALAVPLLLWLGGLTKGWGWEQVLWLGLVAPAAATALLARAHPMLQYHMAQGAKALRNQSDRLSTYLRGLLHQYAKPSGSSSSTSGSSSSRVSGSSSSSSHGSDASTDDGWWSYEWVRAYGERPSSFDDTMHGRIDQAWGGVADPLGYYHVLDASPASSQDDIQAAYRSAVLKYHPDRELDYNRKAMATATFKKIQEAYSVLRDSKKRQEYDRGWRT